jgi:hypothetical protein
MKIQLRLARINREADIDQNVIAGFRVLNLKGSHRCSSSQRRIAVICSAKSTARTLVVMVRIANPLIAATEDKGF